MANKFNDNQNKKNLGWDTVSYTTYRTNYSNDEAMEENSGMPPSADSSFSGLKYLYVDNDIPTSVLLTNELISKEGGIINGVYSQNFDSPSDTDVYNLINAEYTYVQDGGTCGDYDAVIITVGSEELWLNVLPDYTPIIIK